MEIKLRSSSPTPPQTAHHELLLRLGEMRIRTEKKRINISPRKPGVKNPPANAGDARDTGLIPGSGRYLE